MRKFSLIAVILMLGALALSPIIAALELDPLPGDLLFRIGDTPVNIPVAYSLCASVGLALLYKIVKR